MKQRFYLLLSLMVVAGLVISVSSLAAEQKEKQKDKVESKEQKRDKTFFTADEPSGQVFRLEGFSGEGGYLGVYLEEVTAERAKELGLSEERGAIVMKIVKDGPADKSGLKENDVIVSFNERRIDSVREFQRLLSETPAERTVAIEVIRGGSRQTISATLSKRSQTFGLAGPELQGQFGFPGAEGKRGEEARKRAEELLRQNQNAFKGLPNLGDFNFSGQGAFTMFSGTRLGISAESLTDQLAQFFGVKDGHGVLVAQVNENSAAAKAGLQAGDVIIAVDNDKIDSVQALVQALNKKQEGAVTLKIIRNHAEQTVNVTLEKQRTPPPAVRRRAAIRSSAFTSA
jgi:serine protease Do